MRDVDRGVSELLGTVLMVAVVLILASVLTTAVLFQIGILESEAPLAEYEISLSGQSVTVHHLGGESTPAAELTLVLRNATQQYTYPVTTANMSDRSDPRFDPGESWSRTHPLTIPPQRLPRGSPHPPPNKYHPRHPPKRPTNRPHHTTDSHNSHPNHHDNHYNSHHDNHHNSHHNSHHDNHHDNAASDGRVR